MAENQTELNFGNPSGDKSKKKNEKGKAYVSKDNSGSETATSAFNTVELKHINRLLTSLSDCLEDGYMSHIACNSESEKISVALNQDTMHGIIVEEMAVVSSVNTPFCFDTGATSHISPFKSDFVNLAPMEPRKSMG